MITLTLHLKSKWYDMIDSGIKKEEYREQTQYWASRLVSGVTTLGQKDGNYGYIYRSYDNVRFYRGYTKESMLFKFSGVRVDEGDPAWGAVPGEKYFVIKIGERQQ